MRQRVMIAMALMCDPKVLIADEPTTALDVTIQKQILKLMKELNEKLNMAIIMITHDLGVVAEVCDRVTVMYSGKVVEEADVKTVLTILSIHTQKVFLLRFLTSETELAIYILFQVTYLNLAQSKQGVDLHRGVNSPLIAVLKKILNYTKQKIQIIQHVVSCLMKRGNNHDGNINGS